MKSVWIIREPASRIPTKCSKHLLLKGLSTKKSLCFRKPSEELEDEWKNGIHELDGRCHDLLLQELCHKLFNLIDIFWCDIKHVEVDVFWLLKIQSKIKQKKFRKMSTDSLLKKMVFERLDEHLPFFRFKYDSNAFCYSKFPESLNPF